MNGPAARWRARGRHLPLCGHRIFTLDIPATGDARRPPLLVLHGFPTSSFDFHRVVDRLAHDRRVILYDLLGYGLSDKPDILYSFGLQADIAVALCHALGVDHLSLLTHDVGDTLGGELLARQIEGIWDVRIADRILLNGSIYYDLTRLSPGQQALLALPDERLPSSVGPDAETVMAGVAGTFSPGTVVDDEERAAQAEMISHLDGPRLLPRLIRYVEERRTGESRWTGAIEGHPSALTVVWGTDDPIAVPAMIGRLTARRPAARVHRLDGVGHYPMLEAPDRFLEALGVATG